MLKRDAYADHVTARLFDYFSTRAGWQRRLWDVGLVLGLHELDEAIGAADRGALSPSAVMWLAGSIEKLAGPDPGVGGSAAKGALQQCLRSPMPAGGFHHSMLKQLTGQIDGGYLGSWSKAVASPHGRPRPEETAHAVASHLLDAGFSSRFLYRWWAFHVQHQTDENLGLAEIVDRAHSMVLQGPRPFEIVVGVSPLPGKGQTPAGWMSARTTQEWLVAEGRSTAKLRLGGGIKFEIEARDPWAAMAEVSKRLARFQARVQVGTRSAFMQTEGVWVAGEGDKHFPLTPARDVNVLALERQDRLYDETGTSSVDSAFELVAPMDEGPIASAVAGGWAAIESSLTAPGDAGNVITADRMADLVACSYPRAELTKLSAVHMDDGSDQLASDLANAKENRERCRMLVAAITATPSVRFSDLGHEAAAERIRLLHSSPKTVLQEIRDKAIRGFRRLYRQRNLLLHGGVTDAVAVDRALATAGPITGAGLDRIAHAWLVEQMQPLDLAARARLRLDLAGSPDGVPIVDLLEP